MMKKRWISLLVENEVGILARIAGLFSGKSYNLNSLTAGSTEDISISRMTVEVWQLRLSGIASNMIVC